MPSHLLGGLGACVLALGTMLPQEAGPSLSISDLEKALQDIHKLETALSTALPTLKGAQVGALPHDDEYAIDDDVAAREERLLAALEERDAERELVAAHRRSAALGAHGGTLHRRRSYVSPYFSDSYPPPPPSVIDLAAEARAAGEKAIAAASLLAGRMAALHGNDLSTLEGAAAAAQGGRAAAVSPTGVQPPAIPQPSAAAASFSAPPRPPFATVPLATSPPPEVVAMAATAADVVVTADSTGRAPSSDGRWAGSVGSDPKAEVAQLLSSQAVPKQPSPPAPQPSPAPRDRTNNVVAAAGAWAGTASDSAATATTAPPPAAAPGAPRPPDNSPSKLAVARAALYGYAAIFVAALLLAVGCFIVRLPRICGIAARHKRYKEPSDGLSQRAAGHAASDPFAPRVAANGNGQSGSSSSHAMALPPDFGASGSGFVTCDTPPEGHFRGGGGSLPASGDGMRPAYAGGASAARVDAGSSRGGGKFVGSPEAAAAGTSAAADDKGDQVNRLLRSGKPALSVSESTLVANFLARQKDLLILCANENKS